MSQVPAERPEPGAKRAYECRRSICTMCGKIIGESGLCSWECPSDGDHDGKNTVVAVYEVTETFLRNEPEGRHAR